MIVLFVLADIIIGFIALLLIVFTLFSLIHLYEIYEDQVQDLMGFILLGLTCLLIGSIITRLIWGWS